METTTTNNTEKAQTDPNLRPTSIRIDDISRKKLSEIADKMGAKNQNEVFHALVNTWELNEAKYVLPQKEEEIEIFNECAQRMIQLYLGNLEDSKRLRDIIRSEFDNELRSKDNIIRDLQRQLYDSKEKFTDAMDLCNKRDKEKTDLENQLRAKENENKSLKAELAKLSSENDSMKQTIAISEEAIKEHSKLVAERDVLLQDKKTSDFVHNQKLKELELKFREDLLKEKERHHDEYIELVNKVVDNNSSKESKEN